MTISDQDQRFLQGRTRLVRLWPLFGLFLLCALFGLGAWLWLTRPLLINPFAVASALENGQVSTPTLALMAGMLPVLMIMCLTMALVIVLFCFGWITNEKRYLAIIGRLTGSDR